MTDDTPFLPGQRWTSDTESDLGVGIVSSVSGRVVAVSFPASGEQRAYALENAPLTRLRLSPGETASSGEGWEMTIERVVTERGLLVYEGERRDTGELLRLPEVRLSSFTQIADAKSRLLSGQVDDNKWFELRGATRDHLDRVQSSPTFGLAGARIDLIPHQLFIAHTLSERAAPRALLADEVGLGKTIEACLVLHRLLLTGRAGRVLVIVPDALLHQWLVELLRRFNLRFRLFDEARCAAAQETDESVNPFDTEQLVLAPLGLFGRPGRRREALASTWDLVVVDEAHHLRWRPGEASAEYEFTRGLAESSPGLMLLTATPEQLGEEGHFARLHLLDPERFPHLEAFLREQEAYHEISDIVDRLLAPDSEVPRAGLALISKLVGEAVAPRSDADRRELVKKLIDRHGPGRVLFRNTRSNIPGFPGRRVLPYPLPNPPQYREGAGRTLDRLLCPEAGREGDWTAFDPRVRFLAERVAALPGEKMLVICARADTVTALEKALRGRLSLRVAVFHEGMSIVARDRAAHYFAEEAGARVLICSEIGSEGRNFQFARHLVLFDLPPHPDLLEQRIGRLDRIGQRADVHIHVPYLRPGPQETVFRWYHEGLNALAKTCPVGQSIFDDTERDLLGALSGTVTTEALVERTRGLYQTKTRALERGRDRLLEISSCDEDRAAEILASAHAAETRPDASRYMARVFDAYGIEFEHKNDQVHIVRPSEHMRTPHFPHLASGGMTVTFDRATALAHEDVAYLSWEHPMTQGAMELVDTGDHGKAAVIGAASDLLPRGILLVETLHVLEIVAPNAPDLRRFLDSTVRRVLSDEKGRDLDRLAKNGSLLQSVRDVDRVTAKKVISARSREIAAVLQSSEGRAAASFAATVERGKAELARSAGRELERLDYLRSVNASVRREEIELARSRRDAALRSLDDARPRLDAIRLIVTV